ncbi:hypothetical protein GSI_02654 [Ganoderma sinense ZZ0214-1]|uniref:Tc1-like transposase DDE domain-containing protein n=1 Tax=Ganoderma sinense ZZ0214-1 TaxID=1077348 RepID=A0A2G8SM71_9APHY|nr:hypothetical protein GSI_02654 [Ganoderma sinense ZZ0214-1]
MSTGRKRGLSRTLADMGDAVRRKVTGFFGMHGNHGDRAGQALDKENQPVGGSNLAFPRTPDGSQDGGTPRRSLASLVLQHADSTFAEIATPTWSERGASPGPLTLSRTPSLQSLPPGICSGSAPTGSLTALPGSGNFCPSQAVPHHSQARVRQNEEPTNGHQPPPTREVARHALDDLKALLRPRNNTGKRRVEYKGGDVLRERIERMKHFLALYLLGFEWQEASAVAEEAKHHREHKAVMVRRWTRAFIADRHNLPVSLAGTTNVSLLDDEALELAVVLHLQGIGKNVRALDIVDFLSELDVQARFSLSDTVSLSTAQVWMHKLGYRWKRVSNGQYVDGHEREDVVAYRQDVYIPAIQALRPHLRQYTPDGEEYTPPGDHTAPEPGEENSPARILWQDESVFFANDRRELRWGHEDEKATPRAKGNGASLMISDFFTAEDGWLCSEDGKAVVDQFQKAGGIAKKRWPGEKLVMVVDNAPTHQKRADNAPSARKMTKGPSHNFGVKVPHLDDNGHQLRHPETKKPLMKTIRMANPVELDGTTVTQALYFPDDHPTPELRGAFKGMVTLLEERGYTNVDKLLAECKNFKCPAPPPGSSPLEFYTATPCCCRRLLYEQPDFRNVKSVLEIEMEKMGIQVVFLPKFHCELNPIEQCWGHAKRNYRLKPASSKEADLERNLIDAVDAVPLESMRRFFTRALRFADAYAKGLSGKQAAWAAKKYRGHRVIPDTIFEELTANDVNDE